MSIRNVVLGQVIRSKRWVALGAAIALSVGSTSANAQWATFDASNFAQNVMQVQQMEQSLAKLQSQLNQITSTANSAKSQLTSITGSRGLGNLLSQQTQAYATPSTYSSASSMSSVQQLAGQISQQAGYLSTQNMSGINNAYRTQLQNNGSAAATNQAMSEQVFTQSSAEFSNIQSLMSQISQTQDPKAIAELQARIQVEQTLLQNQQIKAQAMLAQMTAQQNVRNEQEQQQAASENMNYYKGN